MFPCDPIATRQLLDAELLVARQRTRGNVVSRNTPRWRAPIARLLTRQSSGPLPAENELFTGLSRKQLARAGGYFTVSEVPAGRSLGQQGAAVSGFVAILEGRIGVTIDGVPHAVLDDGSQLGALPLLDDERPTYRASFNVMVPSRIAIVDAERFPAMLQEFPAIAERIRAIAKLRRMYLAGLASADVGEPPTARLTITPDYPVHTIDGEVAGTRRPVTQGRVRPSR